MQLERIKISNILSFDYSPDLTKTEGTSFSVSKGGSVNILIGPNGSGKSSFLEIINQVFKVGLIKDYVYNKQYVAKNIKNVISENKLYLCNLEKHFGCKDKDSRVALTIVFGPNDYDNLAFVCKYNQKLNDIIQKYSNIDVKFPSMDINKLIFHKTMDFDFLVDLTKNEIVFDLKIMSDEQKFMLLYINNHELIQICMNIYNDFEKMPQDREFYPLKNTFSILGANRNFSDLSEKDSNIDFMSVSAKRRSTYISGQNTKTYDPVSVGYYLCLMKLCNIVGCVQKKCASFQNDKLGNLYEDIYKKELEKSDFYVKLNSTIFTYLGMKLNVEYIDKNFVFILNDSSGNKYHFYELSSGDQSFIMIIFTIFGYDLDGGLLVIDEPEVHLHPQMQKSFMEFINAISHELSLQVILATHSPIMINEKNIYNVYKFSKINFSTIIRNPSKSIVTEEDDLIHMLKFENISKIFFVNKIILLEGETDVYFFDFYLEYLKNSPEWRDKLRDYEILNINGKGSYSRWRSFLSKFGIKSYFIGDWDNIVNNNIVNEMKFNNYRKQIGRYSGWLRKRHEYANPRGYGILADMLRDWYPKEHAYILNSIESIYKKDIFILKKGDLETYIGSTSKGVEETMDFCQNKFESWIKDPKYAGFILEIETIFRRIFGV